MNNSTIEIAMYCPEIPQNVGAVLRLASCFGVNLQIIKPISFIWGHKQCKRASMDYDCNYVLLDSYEHFINQNKGKRIIAMVTHGGIEYTDFQFQRGDIIMSGKESTGLPEEIITTTDHSVTIPMMKNCRSLNVAISISIILSEAVRQTK